MHHFLGARTLTVKFPSLHFCHYRFFFLFKCSNFFRSLVQFERNEVFLVKIVIRLDPVIWDFVECYAWLCASVCVFLSQLHFSVVKRLDLRSNAITSSVVIHSLSKSSFLSLFLCFSLSLSLISWVAKLSPFCLPSVLIMKLKHFLRSQFLCSAFFVLVYRDKKK